MPNDSVAERVASEIKTPALLQLSYNNGKWFTRRGGVLTETDVEMLRSNLVSHWCREIAPALADNAAKDRRIGELERELKIEQLKNSHSLANNICPDHRDKQRGKPCLACEIETLQRKLAAVEAERDGLREELRKSKERERQLDTACKRQQQRNRKWFRDSVIDWILAGWKDLVGELREHNKSLRTELTALREAAEGAKEFCDRVHDGAEDSAWWAKEAGLHLEKLKAALK